MIPFFFGRVFFFFGGHYLDTFYFYRYIFDGIKIKKDIALIMINQYNIKLLIMKSLLKHDIMLALPIIFIEYLVFNER